LVARAHRVLETVRETSYQHVTDIDEGAGAYHCDCSGFVTWLLKKELPGHYAAIPYPKPFRHPRAVEFCRYFENAPVEAKAGELWQRVDRVAELRPGDIVAWRKDPLPETGTTGHVVLVDSGARQVGPDVYEVAVIDSTTSPHKDDTRQGEASGVGRGTMYFKVDGEGRAVARSTRAAEGPFVAYAIGMGRAVVREQ
jgi:hypothetical protein